MDLNKHMMVMYCKGHGAQLFGSGKLSVQCQEDWKLNPTAESFYIQKKKLSMFLL